MPYGTALQGEIRTRAFPHKFRRTTNSDNLPERKGVEKGTGKQAKANKIRKYRSVKGRKNKTEEGDGNE
jgi:hypothetical protein